MRNRFISFSTFQVGSIAIMGIMLFWFQLILAQACFAQQQFRPREPRSAQRRPDNFQPGQFRPGQGRNQQQKHGMRNRQPVSLQETTLQISFGRSLGMMKPLLGINAGPLPSGEKGNAEVTGQYKWAGVREVRTHDFYGPMDLSAIFRDLNADPNNSGSYDFSDSDKYYAAIVNNNMVPYLRLGDSYNNVRIPRTAKELAGYVSASVKVAEHFKLGQMKGFDERKGYIEIGNEPENRQFWPAKYEDFFPCFVEAFKGLKQKMPDQKVGGPAFLVASYKIPAARKNVTSFLSYLQQSMIKPDFISFHLYSNDPAEYFDAVQFYRKEAEKHGMQNAEMHVSEWNTEKDALEFRVGRKAAPYATACWIAMQLAKADSACFYRGTDTNSQKPDFFGLLHADGRKKPCAQAFRLWSRMADYPEQIEISTGQVLIDAQPALQGDLKPLWLLAGRDSAGNIGLLIANIGEQKLSLKLERETGVEVKTIEFSDPRGELIDHRLENAASLMINPLSIQFVSIRK